MHRACWAPVALIALACHVAAGPFQLSEGRVNVVSSTGTTKSGHTFFKNDDSARDAKIALDELDTLKLYFIVDVPEAQPAPKQISVLFQSAADPLKSLVVPLKLRAQNRVRYEVDMAQPPAGLLALGGDIEMRLLIASSPSDETPSPLDLPLGVLGLSAALTARGERDVQRERANAPVEWHVERFGRQPDAHWTFPADEKPVAASIAFASTGIVVGVPLLVLFALLSRLWPRLVFDPRGSSLSMIAFIAVLASFLALATAYFVELRLFPALSWLGGLAFLASWIGRDALSEMQSRRLGKLSKVE